MEGIEPDPRRHRRARRQRQDDAAQHQRHDRAEQRLTHGPPPVRKRGALVTVEHGRPQNGRGNAHWWSRMVSKGLMASLSFDRGLFLLVVPGIHVQMVY